MRIIAQLLLCGMIAGCAPSQQEPLVIRGSNTFGEELAPALIAEYKKEHPAATFDTEFKATSYGIGALLAGKCDIAAASRVATTNEVAMGQQRGVELIDYVIGSYSVAVVVNAGNAVANLTLDQVRDIFAGTIQNWKDLGGTDAPIHLYVRDPISGTYLGFRELAMENKPYSTDVKTATSYADIAKAVAADPNAIGYTSVELPKDANVKVVSIGGAAPSVAAVEHGQYPYLRPLRLYTSKTNETTDAHEFIQFVLSAKGQQILKQTGLVPSR